MITASLSGITEQLGNADGDGGDAGLDRGDADDSFDCGREYSGLHRHGDL